MVGAVDIHDAVPLAHVPLRGQDVDQSPVEISKNFHTVDLHRIFHCPDMGAVVVDPVIVFDHMFPVPLFLHADTVFDREDWHMVSAADRAQHIPESFRIDLPAPFRCLKVRIDSPAGMQFPSCRHAGHTADIAVLKLCRPFRKPFKIRCLCPVTTITFQQVTVEGIVHYHDRSHNQISPSVTYKIPETLYPLPPYLCITINSFLTSAGRT